MQKIMSQWFPTSFLQYIFKIAALIHISAFLFFESFDLVLDTIIPLKHEALLLWILQKIMFFSLLFISGVICIEGAKILLGKSNVLHIKNARLKELTVIILTIAFFIISYIDDKLESKLLTIGQFLAERSPISVDLLLFGIITYKMIDGTISTLFRPKKELTPHMVLAKLKTHIWQFCMKTAGVLIIIKVLLHGAGHHKLAYAMLGMMYHIITGALVSLSIGGIGFGTVTLFNTFLQRKK